MAAVPQLSYSGVRAYAECPLRWKFLYIDKIPEAPRGYFSFGRTVHSVLEELMGPLVVPVARRTTAGRLQRTLMEFPAGRPDSASAIMSEEAMRASYDRNWSSEGYQTPEEEARYRQLGWGLLKQFRHGIALDPPMPIAVEPHLEARWDGIPVHGYVDRVDRTGPETLEVIDYKTSQQLSEADARGSDQLTLYQVLVESNFPGTVDALTLFHLRRQQALRSGRRGRADLEALYDRVGEVYDGIRTESYEPRPGRHCGRCEFQSRCPEFRTVPEGERARLSALVDRFAGLRREEERLEGELRSTAEELHRAAEALGVHRMPGSRETLLRRREEEWSYAHVPNPAGTSDGRDVAVDFSDARAVRKWLRDPRVPAEVRRAVADGGRRKERYYWSLESSDSSETF